MMRTNVFATICLLIIACTLPLMAQNSVSTGDVVPHLVNYSGKTLDPAGKPLSGIAGVTFAIYKDQSEGSPLWLETQNVTADGRGNYTVQLGTTKPDGLPLALFSSAEARWLGVTVNGGAEQPRVLLLSVPYALKAADAETVGGLPASAFVLAAPPVTTGTATSTATPANASTYLPVTGTTPVTTAGGTVNKLAKFDAKADITNSLIFDNGTDVGIGNTAPAAKLDVSGTGIFRGALKLPALASATASAGKDSQSLNFTASAFNSSTAAAVNQNFRWQAEAAANDTASPSGTLNLLAGSGTAAPNETGLKIAETGVITFAAGQTFPGGGGSVTSVGLSAPASDFTVSGSPVKSAGTLGLNWTVAPTSSATANAIVKRDSTGSFSAGSIIASLGVTGASTGVGVYGESTGTVSGDNGVQGVTFAGPGSGVAGFNNSGAAGAIGVYGQGDTAVYANGTTTGVFGHGSSYGFATDGNVQQARTAGGWVKAMVVIQGIRAPYTIPNCFNSTLAGAAATTPPCGFTLSEVQPGEFTVGLGFEVDDRFVSATLECCFSYGVAPVYVSKSGSDLTVFTWDGGNTQPYQASVLVY
jgi:hypothetical protein